MPINAMVGMATNRSRLYIVSDDQHCQRNIVHVLDITLGTTKLNDLVASYVMGGQWYR